MGRLDAIAEQAALTLGFYPRALIGSYFAAIVIVFFIRWAWCAAVKALIRRYETDED